VGQNDLLAGWLAASIPDTPNFAVAVLVASRLPAASCD